MPAWMASLATWATPTVDSGRVPLASAWLGGLGAGHLLESLGDPVRGEQ